MSSFNPKGATMIACWGAVCIILVLLPACMTADRKPFCPKDRSVYRVRKVLDQLCQLAYRNSTNNVDAKTRSHITHLVDELESTQELALLGRLCAEIAWPQTAGDGSFDLVLDCASWHCFFRIAERTDTESMGSLEYLQSRYGYGGELLIFLELRKRQRALKVLADKEMPPHEDK